MEKLFTTQVKADLELQRLAQLLARKASKTSKIQSQ